MSPKDTNGASKPSASQPVRNLAFIKVAEIPSHTLPSLSPSPSRQQEKQRPASHHASKLPRPSRNELAKHLTKNLQAIISNHRDLSPVATTALSRRHSIGTSTPATGNHSKPSSQLRLHFLSATASVHMEPNTSKEMLETTFESAQKPSIIQVSEESSAALPSPNKNPSRHQGQEQGSTRPTPNPLSQERMKLVEKFRRMKPQSAASSSPATPPTSIGLSKTVTANNSNNNHSNLTFTTTPDSFPMNLERSAVVSVGSGVGGQSYYSTSTTTASPSLQSTGVSTPITTNSSNMSINNYGRVAREIPKKQTVENSPAISFSTTTASSPGTSSPAAGENNNDSDVTSVTTPDPLPKNCGCKVQAPWTVYEYQGSENDASSERGKERLSEEPTLSEPPVQQRQRQRPDSPAPWSSSSEDGEFEKELKRRVQGKRKAMVYSLSQSSLGTSTESLFAVLPRRPTLGRRNELDALLSSSGYASDEKSAETEFAQIPLPESPTLGHSATPLRISNLATRHKQPRRGAVSPVPGAALPQYREPSNRPAYPSTVYCASEACSARAVLPGMSIPLSEMRREERGDVVLSQMVSQLLNRHMIRERESVPVSRVRAVAREIPVAKEEVSTREIVNRLFELDKKRKAEKRKERLAQLAFWRKKQNPEPELELEPRLSDEDNDVLLVSESPQKFQIYPINQRRLTCSELQAKRIIDKWGDDPPPARVPDPNQSEEEARIKREDDSDSDDFQVGTQKNKIPILPRILVPGKGPRFEFPEAIVTGADVDFCYFTSVLSIKDDTAEQWLRKATLWLPDECAIIRDIKAMSSLPNRDGEPVKLVESEDVGRREDGQSLDSDIDLLQQHLRLGLWSWILGSDGDIDVENTAVLIEARAQFYTGENRDILRRFCKGELAFCSPLFHRSHESDLKKLILASRVAEEAEWERVKYGECSKADVDMIDVFVAKGFLSAAIDIAIERRWRQEKKKAALVKRELARAEWSIAKTLWESVRHYKIEKADRRQIRKMKKADGFLSRRAWRENQREKLRQGIVNEDPPAAAPPKSEPAKTRGREAPKAPNPTKEETSMSWDFDSSRTSPPRRTWREKGKMKAAAYLPDPPFCYDPNHQSAPPPNTHAYADYLAVFKKHKPPVWYGDIMKETSGGDSGDGEAPGLDKKVMLSICPIQMLLDQTSEKLSGLIRSRYGSGESLEVRPSVVENIEKAAMASETATPTPRDRTGVFTAKEGKSSSSGDGESPESPPRKGLDKMSNLV